MGTLPTHLTQFLPRLLEDKATIEVRFCCSVDGHTHTCTCTPGTYFWSFIYNNILYFKPEFLPIPTESRFIKFEITHCKVVHTIKLNVIFTVTPLFNKLATKFQFGRCHFHNTIYSLSFQTVTLAQSPNCSKSQVHSQIRNAKLFEELFRNLWLEGKGTQISTLGCITQCRWGNPW